MLKYAVLFLFAVFSSVQSQRPWHAGTGGRLPQVLPQYIDERIAAEQAAQANQTTGQPAGQEILGMPSQGAQFVPLGSDVQVIPGITSGNTQIPIQTTTTGVSESVVGNRIDDASSAVTTTLSATLIPTLPSDLPVDAHGDVDLVNRIKTWPRDKQPFWYINWQAIQAHRGDVNNTAQPVQTQPNTRSFFAGR